MKKRVSAERAHGNGTTAMQVFKFNVAGRTVERAVADAIGYGIAARRASDDDVPQRFKQLLSRLDDIHRDQSHNLSRLQSRKPKED